MKLKRFLLRYYPPGLILEYQQQGQDKRKTIDLLDFRAQQDTAVKDTVDQLILNEPLITESKREQVTNLLNKLQSKLEEPEKNYFYVDQVLESHLLPLTNVAFNKLGTLFATGSYDNTCKVWETDSGNVRQNLEGHGGVVFSVAFNNPFADKVLTGSFDRTSRIWDAESGECLHILQGHTAEVVCGQFDHFGGLIATGSMDSTSILWDVNYGEAIRKFSGHKAEIVVTVFNPDGDLILTGSFDHSAALWDVRNDQSVMRLVGHEGEISQGSFHWTGIHVLTGSIDGTARIWDIRKANVCVQTLGGQQEDEAVLDAKYCLNGQMIGIASDDGTVHIYHNQQSSTASSTTNGGDYVLLTTLTGHEDEVSQVNFNPRGSRVLTSSADGTARLWELTGDQVGTCRQVLIGHSDEIFSSTFSYDGDVIVTASKDNTCRVWR